MIEETCNGKRIYRSEHEARAVRSFRYRRRETRRLRIYKCPACKGWHLTSAKNARHE